MNETDKIIRDFLYLDSERLYSLSSQVFEGVADHIAESFQSERSQTNTARTLSGKSLDEKVANAALRTENKILYDHLYNQLEDKLRSTILEPTGIDANNFHEMLSDSFLIKVRGQAVIDDYGRLSKFMERFNELGLSIAVITTFQTGELELAIADFGRKRTELQEKLRVSKNALEKSQLKEALQKMEHLSQPVEFLAAFARDRNLQQDPAWINALNVILEVFRSDTYEINVTLPNQGTPISFRGVVDKRWLRSEPEHLRSLYGGSRIPHELVMVGQLTYMPSSELQIPVDGVETAGAEKSMKDVSHDMFRIMSTLDEMMTSSKQGVEMLVRPLAIYQEVSIPSASSVVEELDKTTR